MSEFLDSESFDKDEDDTELFGQMQLFQNDSNELNIDSSIIPDITNDDSLLEKEYILTFKNGTPILIDDEEQDKLSNLIYIVTNKQEKDIGLKCQFEGCDKTFTNPSHLKVHLARRHTGHKPFVCEICLKKFSTTFEIKTHKRSHTNERPYGCKNCVKTFKTSSDLSRHNRIHTGTRPYKCSECEMTFVTSSSCKMHMRTHTNEKPYKCPIKGCNKSFMSGTNQKNHIRTHTGEKPYKCPLCSKGFAEYSSLYKHKSTIHEPKMAVNDSREMLFNFLAKFKKD